MYDQLQGDTATGEHVRVTRNTVEVFFGGNRICSHVRLYGRANQYSTTEAHMPPNHRPDNT